MTQVELKAKIGQVMLAHLKAVGYPNLTPEQIMNELKPMWIKLEDAQLIQPGMSFQGFVEQAHQAHIHSQMRDFFRL